MPNKSLFLTSIILILSFITSGCSITGGIASALSDSVLNQDDLETVRDGSPTLMILIDGMILNDPEDEDILLTGAKLYGAYSAAFVTDKERSQKIAVKAKDYARRALCEELKKVCRAIEKPLDDYQQSLGEVDEDGLVYLYGFASAWASWIQAHAADWMAIADLPKVEASMRKIITIDDRYDNGTVHIYLGVLNSQLPESLGGKPEIGKKHFEKAIAISQGRNLMAKVLYAKNYAKLVFDRELHDQLLNEVISADAKIQGYTLLNTLAKQQAIQLLADSEKFF